MKSPILGSAYVARSVNAADNRCVNLFAEIVPEAGKEPAYLQRAPGLQFQATIGDGPIRGMWAFSNDEDHFFVVSGTGLYKVHNDYTYTLLGTVSGSAPVSMADNGTQLFVAWYDRRNDLNNGLMEVFGRWGTIDTNGAVNLGNEFQITPVSFPHVFSGTDTNNLAAGLYDPVYPPGGTNLHCNRGVLPRCGFLVA